MAPRVSRSELLKRIHNSHLRAECLNRARECVFWPAMTAEIKDHVSICEAYREYERVQAKQTMISPETPSRPWQRVAADLCEAEGKLTWSHGITYFF